MKFKKGMVIAMCFITVLALGACSKGTSTTKASESQKVTDTGKAANNKNQTSSSKKQEETAKKTTKKTTPQVVAPLTGLPVKDEAQNHRRVVGVMVNNYYLARPQTGLQKADIVYEVLAEGRITRFLALFQSEVPKTIGPVRSARPYFIRLAEGYHGFYVAHGWSPQAKKILTSGTVDNINGMIYDGTLFHRVSFRNPPHNSYITYDNILKGAKMNHYSMKDDIKPLPFLSNDQIDQLQGDQVDKVSITYGKDNIVSYHYNTKTGVFDRYINGKQAKDRETGTPLVANNVFIVEAHHWFIDSYPRRAIDLKSGGNAYLLQKGKLQKVEWKNVNNRILPYKDGKPLGFVPGKTWINIIPKSEGLKGMVNIQAVKGS